MLGVLYTVIEPNKPLLFNLFPSAAYHFPVYLDQNSLDHFEIAIQHYISFCC